ncbi:uncharacterized protein BDW47DRAFT_102511 [Aspergillus candidus]|uniref:Ubiquitin 3 binding protein But2 C-terminal domain-containing protein n=1 Tax=Aspergillus candidus TaxID=41067 RepID=A0A2I2FGT3_ASPCN|nr:hypothetical protein BDW47DRAFT_102511 [Aspergillus candidus]PLB39841.1 hypothetical protein BDW47DRAFT_102511 [Aspergillus candidus]
MISSFSCPAGQAVSYEMKSGGSTDLEFFQDYNPAPYVPSLTIYTLDDALTYSSLGLYITVC